MSSQPAAEIVESVWDYPRPPRLESSPRHLRITHEGMLLAATTRALRILETSHPPVFYIPQADIRMHLLRPSARRGSFCEFKGIATYWDLDLAGARLPDGHLAPATAVVPAVAWSYAEPSAAFQQLKGHLAFYASRLDRCTVDGEPVLAQPGDFYGGWITSHVRGPFKGSPGTLGW